MGINHQVGAPEGNQRARKAVPNRAVMPCRIRDDHLKALQALAEQRQVKLAVILDEVLADFTGIK